MEARSPRGADDILPEEVELWRRVEETVADVMRAYGYREIRTPVFEHTELFYRGVGETTDVVEKQMYTFSDRGGRSLTLRPEGTAPVVRAFLQHKLYGRGLPQNLWYIQPMFRYERPQAGRSRQFHQFGAESLGSLDPLCDVEVISIPLEVYRRLGLDDCELLLNSIGCPACRPRYREELRRFLAGRLEALCPTCRSRYERNPLRVLDCKDEGCRAATEGAPSTLDFLCDECRDHFASVRRLLEATGVEYRLDSRLVRGLDYYTKTVFEIVTGALGAQDALAGGGRYDGLAEELGGPPTPAVGFGAGMERAVLALKRLAGGAPVDGGVDVYVASVGQEGRVAAVALAQKLRSAGFSARLDYRDPASGERSLRAQLKAAGKGGARLVVIAGEEELSRGAVTLKSMDDGAQVEVAVESLLAEVEAKLGGERPRAARPVV